MAVEITPPRGRATASEREGGLDQDWVDAEGYEERSTLLTLDEALEVSSDDLLAPVYLQLLRGAAD